MGAPGPGCAADQAQGTGKLSPPHAFPADGIRLPDRTLIRMQGADKAVFFDRVLTQGFRDFPGEGRPEPPPELVYAALLTPQGKVVGDLFCACPETAPDSPGDNSEGDFLLDLPESRAAGILAALNRYRLRALIGFAPWPGLAVWASESALAGALFTMPDPRPGMGWRTYRPVDAPVPPGPEPTTYRARRFSALVPDPAWDSRPESDFALELNLDLLAAIDFKKGCFVGQEVTSRMKRKGRIRTRSRLVEILPASQFGGPASGGSVPEYGARIIANGLELGEIRSALPGGSAGEADHARALAVIRLDRWAEVDATQIHLADGRPVRLIGALED